MSIKPWMMAVPMAMLLAGCLENVETAATMNSSGGTATGTISPRSNGGYVLSFTTQGKTCTGIFDKPVAGTSELSPVNCTSGAGGNATLIYGAGGKPASATFGGLDIGSGTLKF